MGSNSIVIYSGPIVIIFKPSVKKYLRVRENIKEIVVAGVNTNPGGVPT